IAPLNAKLTFQGCERQLTSPG
ncbi:MAG: hypothetical protein JWO68_3462, partial [Actinomycetia bacterium]|nr:hypothetical protein [Actinomycetes bacterium]